MSDAIFLESVTKTFGAKVAVADLDLAVPRGTLLGFIGPNGAGKTTTIRMIMSILFPDRGTVSVLGRASALEAKDRIGYLPEERGLYKKMKVRDFLAYIARLKGVDERQVTRRVHEWLGRVGLEEAERKKCEELSKGMQQKVQFVASVIHEPELLILDEPFSGLDPVNTRLLRQLLLEQHARGATVVFSTHVMVQAEQICQQLVMINDGRKVLDDSLANIRAAHDPRTLLFEPLDPQADLAPLRALPAVADVGRADGTYEILLREGYAPAEVMRDVVAAVPPARVEVRRPTLEDVFVGIVAGDVDHSPDIRALRASLREPAGSSAAGQR
ncbi:MAG: ATP-binding cassette domain-containing protein [Acidobacteria bacterium]|nr:ATP-binding cassette domain-containing protein [Acidobacteriota bacterium]